MRFLPVVLCLAACSSQVVETDTVTATPHTEVEPESVGLLKAGDILIDRVPPPFPDSTLADSIRQVRLTEATALEATQPYGLDSVGREIPLTEVLRTAEASIPTASYAAVQFVVAWDGSVQRAEVVQVRGEVAAEPVRRALGQIGFQPPWYEGLTSFDRTTPVPNGAYFTLIFRGSG